MCRLFDIDTPALLKRHGSAERRAGEGPGKLTRRRFACLTLPLMALPFMPGVVLAASLPQSAPPLGVEEVEHGIYVHRGVIDLMREGNEGAIANIGFIVGEEAVAVIDSGGSVLEGRRLIAAIRQITDLPIRFVINTHMHPDHVFGNAAFLGDQASFVGHRNLAAALAARRDSYLASNVELMGAALMRDIAILPPTVPLSKPMTLPLGGRDLSVTPWPTSHTDNDVTVYDERTRTLFAGDLVFMDHCPTLDGSVLGWLKTIEALKDMPAKRVVPGHGPASAAWPAALDDQTRYLKTLVTDLRAAISAGRSMAEAVPEAAKGESARWHLFDEYNARNATGAYAELEWE